MPIDGQLLNNRYRLIARVASGGMAIVYKAQDTMLGRIVALKILRESFAEDPSFQARFQREAQAVANLSHPNIVTVHDFGLDGDKHYIVMEYVEGSDLKQLIRQEAPFSPQRVLELSTQICAAIGAAHRAGVIHCDVKPQNVLVTPEGLAKVTDFGIARALSSASSGVTTGIWGTPHYFSPEQAGGEPPSPASDVYSIGVIMYEMLAGRLPFEGDNQQQLAMAHLRDQPPPLSSLNPAVPLQLEQIVARAMAKEPSQRYRNADQMGRLLHEYQSSSEQATSYQRLSPELTTSSTLQQIRSGQGEFNWAAWLLAAVAAVLVIGLFPLYMLVYQKWYGGERIPTTSTPPVPTLTASPVATISDLGQETRAPDLRGRSRQEAEALLAQAGLQLVIKEERFDDKAPAGTVLEQSLAPNAVARRGDVIGLVLSKGPPVSNMVSVIGLQYDEQVRKGLESYGWVVNLDSEWSQSQPVGYVLSQIPPPGTPLTRGLPLTLLLSSGTVISLNVNLGNMIKLDGARLERDTFHPGETIEITFKWYSRVKSVPRPFKVFVHLIGPTSSKPVAQVDSEPQGGGAPTNTWHKDALVEDFYALHIPVSAQRGTYTLRVGMYPADGSSGRLPVVDAGKTSAESDSILVREIVILP